MMNNRKLGRTGLQVSELCLGTMHFGWRTNEAASWALLDEFRRCGGNFLQATGVCPATSAGVAWTARSESHVGDWMCARRIPRNDWVISTRFIVGRPAAGGRIRFADEIRQACEASLRRLRTSHIDLLVLQWNQALLPIADVLEALDDLVRAGMVRYVGAAGFPAWRLMEALAFVARRNHCRMETAQADYSLLRCGVAETDLLDLCREHRLGFLPSSPLAGGLLAGLGGLSVGLSRAREQRFERTLAEPGHRERLELLATLAAERGAAPAQMALAWLLADPAVTSPIVGVATSEHLRDLAAATRITLSADERAALAGALPLVESTFATAP
jgi:aryl-alcohol dehydrogenase-like predicted oxidoreductase